MKTTKSPLLLLSILLGLLLGAGCSGGSVALVSHAVPESTMLAGIPDVRQAEYYSCGASSYQALLAYYGISSFETDLRTMLNTSDTHGTYSWDLVRVAQEMGFVAEWRENCTLDDIYSDLKLGYPVITRSQRVKDAAPGTWDTTWTVGHYMVVIGLDQQNIYLEDPYLIGSRLKMTRDDFVASWHSYDTVVPIPPDSRKVYHEAVFIHGTLPAGRQEYHGPLEVPDIVRPVVIQPPYVDPYHVTP